MPSSSASDKTCGHANLLGSQKKEGPLGRPVEDAYTQIHIDVSGEYDLHVRHVSNLVGLKYYESFARYTLATDYSLDLVKDSIVALLHWGGAFIRTTKEAEEKSDGE